MKLENKDLAKELIDVLTYISIVGNDIIRVSENGTATSTEALGRHICYVMNDYPEFKEKFREFLGTIKKDIEEQLKTL